MPTSTNQPSGYIARQTVHVAIYEHAHGMDVRVFTDPEQAASWRTRIAREWWNDAFDAAPPPPDEIGSEYFERMADHGEYFSTMTCRIECGDPDPTDLANPAPETEDGGAS
ncbi:hypothetical protein MR829_13990 [Paracoccus versutus]|uniref:hypothetical protein n=1 Tax=Paracoccus versutus TaxID=34007 RepID=UPI001FB7D716|nr:hypothetical protein [Paracoccus versutus]MCJ1901479.1 hypothetical protein [Paracoccus versutus]